MTYTFKLAKRLASLHSWGVVAPLLFAAACNGAGDTVTTPDSPQSTQTDQSTDLSGKQGRPWDLKSIVLTPASVTVKSGATQQFTASGLTYNGKTTTISATYSATGGTITSGGLYTGGSTAGTYRVIATQSGGTLADTSTVVVTTSSTTPDPTPSPTTPPSCSSYSYSRLVSVSSAAQLASAFTNAQPGDLIKLADGVYNGQFKTYASGTASAPIILCGTRRAVLSGGSLSSGNGIFLRGSRWILAGFSVTYSQAGIAIWGGNYNVLDGLEIYGVGQAGVHMHVLSTHNVVKNSYIHDTGKYIAEYGEGVYIGSYSGQWCSLTNCQPDKSDYNSVINTTIGPNIGSDLVDVKEGTSGTLVDGNILNGIGQGYSKPWNNVWIVVSGSNGTYRNNRGNNAPVNGFWTAATAAYPGQYGNNNVFENNYADLRATGYGFLVDGGTTGNVVRCNNTVVNAGSGFANVKCTL